MQNHNVIKKEAVHLRDVKDTVNNLDNLLDSIGVEIEYHFWVEDEETFVNMPLQCYLIPTEKQTIGDLLAGTNLDLILTKDKFATALANTDTTFRNPSSRDGFTVKENRYKVTGELSVNLTDAFGDGISSLLVAFSGIRQTNVKKNVSFQ